MIESFLPPSLKEFAPYISPFAFRVVSKTEVLARVLKMGQHALSGEGAKEIREELQDLLPTGIKIIDFEHPIKMSWIPVDPSQHASQLKRVGDLLLQIYFTQLFNPRGIFCDLRFEHFFYDVENSQLIWRPNNLWFTFDPSFREGLGELYKGYYEGKANLLIDSLLKLKLIAKNTSDAYKMRFLSALQKHFGVADQAEVRFSAHAFRDSFHEIFALIKEANHQIPADFAFLGLYLVGLYLSLDKLGQAHDVKLQYQAAIMAQRAH